MKKNLIFFSIIYWANKYYTFIKKNIFGSTIIIVTGSENLLFPIKKINLEKKYGVKIYNFCSSSLKNPLNIFKMYFRFHLSKDSKSILKYNFDKAYIFSQHEDFVAPIFLSKCKIKKIYQIMIYEGKNYKRLLKKFTFKDQKKIDLRIKFKFIILKFLQNDKRITLSLQKNKFYSFIHFKVLEKK